VVAAVHAHDSGTALLTTKKREAGERVEKALPLHESQLADTVIQGDA
jgi:hypothetical protein